MSTSHDDPSTAEVEARHPGWRVWRGVNDLVYARRYNSSAPIVLTDENTVELEAKIVAKKRELGE